MALLLPEPGMPELAAVCRGAHFFLPGFPVVR